MFSCGHYVQIDNKLKYTLNKKNDKTIRLTLSFEKDEKFLFIPNKILNILNPNDNRLQYGYYAFMLTRVINDGYEKRNDAVIGFSQNPILSTYLHNINKTLKEKKINMEWELSRIIGPFRLREACIDCCNKWQDATRGIPSKENKSEILQEIHDMSLYKKYSPINETYLNSILDNLPIGYRENINKMID